MWCNFEQSTVEDETISNAFSARGIFKIRSDEEVKVYPQVHASLQNKKVVISIDKSLILLEDELVAKCSFLSFEAQIDTVAISSTGNLIVCGLSDGEVHGIYIKGVPLFSLSITVEDVNSTGRTFTCIDQLDGRFHISCTNGSIYRISEIDETPLEANLQISLTENESVAIDEALLEQVAIERLASDSLSDITTSVLVAQQFNYEQAFSSEQTLPYFIAGAHNKIFCKSSNNNAVKIALAECFEGVKCIYNLDNYILILTNSGHLLEMCPYTKTLYYSGEQTAAQILIHELIVMDCSDENIELLVLTKSKDATEERLMKIIEYPSFKCNNELEVSNHAWLVQQPKCSVNLYYLSGGEPNDNELPSEVEMILVSETLPSERFKKLIAKGHLEEAEEFGKQFELCLQPIYEAKAKRVLLTLASLSDDNPELVEEHFQELLQLLQNIESSEFFKQNRMINMPSRHTLERYLKEMLRHLNEETEEYHILEINEQLRRLETLTIIDPYECNADWYKFVYHANLVKMVVALFKSDIPAACLIWKRHASAMLPKLDENMLQQLLGMIHSHTEPFYVVQWLRQFVPTVSNTHPKLMPLIAEWSIQKTRALQYANHWPEIGLEFATKVCEIFEEVQFMHSDVRRQHERNIIKLRDLVNALQDLAVLKKRYNLIFTLDNYLQDSIDETALCILQRVHLDNLKSLVNDFLYPIFQEKGKTPIEPIEKYIALLVTNRNTLSTWLERAVACIELLHHEDNRLESALLVLQRAPVPWPDSTAPLVKLRYSTHPLALKINTEYEIQVIKIMKVKYGWPADTNADINLNLFMRRIIKMHLPDMLDDIRVLTQAAPEIATSANFNCCYQLVRSGKTEIAYEFFKSLDNAKNSKARSEIIELFAELLENSYISLDDKNIEEQRNLLEFYKLITPHACRSAEARLKATQNRFILCQKFRLNVCFVSELVSYEQRLQLLDQGIECIMEQSQATVNVPKFIVSEVSDLCAALQLEKVYGVWRICQRIQCLPLTCALAYTMSRLVDCTPANKEHYISLALELLSQQILALQQKKNWGVSILTKENDTLTFPLVYELLLHASLLERHKLSEIIELLKYVQLCSNAYPLDAVESYYHVKEREVNECICRALDAAEITVTDITLNFSTAQLNCSFEAKPTVNKGRYSVSIFDQIDLLPEQPKKKNYAGEQLSIVKFVARSLQMLVLEQPPANKLLQQLRTLLGDNIEKESAREEFFISLEQLIKTKIHDVWYIMAQYLLDYQQRISCNFISNDFVSLHLSRVFRNVMSHKDINFIELFVMLIADNHTSSLLKILENDLKSDQQRVNLLTLLEMYNVHLEKSDNLEQIRNKRIRQYYYMEFCKLDPSIRGKFNTDIDDITQLLKIFQNKQLDVTLLERMSRDCNLDYQQLLITQVISILQAQEMHYEIKTDTFGEEELVMLTTVDGISALCRPFLNEIKNAELLTVKLIQFIQEINIYFYELYLCIIEILSFFDNMAREMQVWKSILHFLKHKMVKRRRNRPGQLETDMWLQSQAEIGIMPKIARYRLPFKPIVEQPLKDILDNELNIDNCESWFPLIQMHTVLKGSTDVAKMRDYFCMSAVKNSITEYKSKNESETWHLQPTNNAFLQSILRLARHVTSPDKVFMILYFVSNYAPDGADQVEATFECYKYALTNENYIVHEKSQEQLIKIKRKYPILKTQHLLYVYGLTDEKLLRLVENPTELIYNLYNHELILKSSKLDINTVVEEIAELHKLDLEAIQFHLLQKWLSFTIDTPDGTVLEETFTEDQNLLDTTVEDTGNAAENVIRANYVLNSWPKKKAIQFLVAHIFPADGSINTSKMLQMYECFSKLNDGSDSFESILNQRQYITIKCVHELKQLGYTSSLEKFASCNKIDILKTIWQRNAQNPHTMEILANICLGFDIYMPKIWNGILKRMAMFNMVRELNALVDVLSCQPKLLHTEGLIIAWECVLKQPFKGANQTRSFLQENVLHKVLFRMQSCPIVHKLNLLEFVEYCISLERPHIAAVIMGLCRDANQRNAMKKLILPRKTDKMRKDILNLEDAGILSVVINFALKELEL